MTAWQSVRTVLLPGRLEDRARAAASLPRWLTPLFVILLLPLFVEVSVYTGETLDKYLQIVTLVRYPSFAPVRLEPPTLGSFVSIARGNLGLYVLPHLAHGRGRIIALVAVGLALAALEVVNIVALVPFAVPFGQRFFQVEPRTRNVILSLGSFWLLQAVILWALIVVFVGPAAYFLFLRNAPDNIPEGFIIFITAFTVPLLLTHVWVFRLIRACSRLAGPPRLPLEARCGYCGYFLEGLAQGAGCPECGAPAPISLDRNRMPSDWARRRQVGRLAGLLRPVVQVLVAPSRLFGRMEVLSYAGDARRFYVAALSLGLVAWVIALPGMAQGMAGDAAIRLGDHLSTLLIAPPIALVSSLIGILVFGLLICLLGGLISRARQEPAWPIAAGAGCYLAGLFPWVVVAQSLWIIAFFAVAGYDRIERLSMYLQSLTRIDWPIFFVVILVLPAAAGVLLAIRTTLVCYRNTRYACR